MALQRGGDGHIIRHTIAAQCKNRRWHMIQPRFGLEEMAAQRIERFDLVTGGRKITIVHINIHHRPVSRSDMTKHARTAGITMAGASALPDREMQDGMQHGLTLPQFVPLA